MIEYESSGFVEIHIDDNKVCNSDMCISNGIVIKNSVKFKIIYSTYLLILVYKTLLYRYSSTFFISGSGARSVNKSSFLSGFCSAWTEIKTLTQSIYHSLVSSGLVTYVSLFM